MSSTTKAALVEAERELFDWANGNRSWHNLVEAHADEAEFAERRARADAAQIKLLAARVAALRELDRFSDEWELIP